MNYRSFADLASTVSRELWRVPGDIDVVVGVPRSGLFAAWYIALLLNRRVVDLTSFLHGSLGGNGLTRPLKAANGHHGQPRKILLVDDCVESGDSMALAVAQIREGFPDLEIVTLAVFVVPKQARSVEISMELCRTPRIFEWNIFHSWIVERSHYDLDGVLCVDPGRKDDDDGAQYLHFIRNATPLIAPTGRVRKIVTARLEKHREPTEEWLDRHGIAYDELVMLDLPTAAERDRLGIHAAFKADVYKSDSDADLFIESDAHQARKIARLSGKQVFDHSVRNMIQPDRFTLVYHERLVEKFFRRAPRRALRELRALVGS